MFTSGAPDLQSLMQLLDAAQMGWWKADFRTGELFFSDYIVDLLGLGSNRAAVGPPHTVSPYLRPLLF